MGKKGLFSFIAVVGIGLVIYFAVSKEINRLGEQTNSNKESYISNTASMQITSPAFESNGQIPEKYTCEGDGVNPPLQFKDVPPEAKSLALIIDDPDAPSTTWVHWLVWNISPGTTEIPENSFPPEAIQGMTDFGQQQYGAPCPPTGSHRYFFKLYALDSKLSLSSFSDKAALEKAILPRLLTKAELVGLYQRKTLR